MFVNGVKITKDVLLPEMKTCSIEVENPYSVEIKG